MCIRDRFKAPSSFEDIHSYIQALVEKSAGKAALKLHTCRSRNDQVVLDTKIYCLKEIQSTTASLIKFYSVLKKAAKANKDIIMPGYTHLQHAMPLALKTYLEAYAQMISRDGDRLARVFDTMELTFGAGALAGTLIPAGKYTQKANSVPKAISAGTNSLDAVSDRDFVIEILSALAILGMHLSRLAEDMILWSSKEFDFVEIDEAFCTGSSLMPQKKNPDVLELVRGYAGRLYGHLVSVLVIMKGLPMSYNRDMQLDKEPLFDAFEIVQAELKVMTALFENVSFKKENIEKQLKDETLYATDLADYLVRKGVAFKDAHAAIGKLVRYKLSHGKDILGMTDAQLKAIHPLLTSKAVKKILRPEASVSSKKSVKA